MSGVLWTRTRHPEAGTVIVVTLYNTGVFFRVAEKIQSMMLFVCVLPWMYVWNCVTNWYSHSWERPFLLSQHALVACSSLCKAEACWNLSLTVTCLSLSLLSLFRQSEQIVFMYLGTYMYAYLYM